MRGEWEGGEGVPTLFVLIWRASLASFAATVTVKRPHSETEKLKKILQLMLHKCSIIDWFIE